MAPQAPLPAAVVLFGASGFIGRNLAAALAGRVEHLVAVTARTPAVAGCDATVPFAHLDGIGLLPADTVVVNVAARRYDARRFAAEQPAILDENVRLATGLYRFCAARGIREVRTAGSVAVYPAALDLLDDAVPVDMNAWPHAGEAAYAWSKRFAETAADVHRRSHGIATVTLRLSNPYGPFDTLDADAAHVATAFVLRALGPAPVFEIRGDATAERDFIHADEVAAAFVATLRSRDHHAAYNLASGATVTVRALAEAVLRAAGVDKPIRLAADTAGRGVRRRAVVAARLRQAFALPPPIPLADGLASTIAWYRDALR